MNFFNAVSMVEAEFLDKLETIARLVRKISKPFGGIQLVFCGDFMQLPPGMKFNCCSCVLFHFADLD